MSIDTEKYNGWTNYATWNVNLWMLNDSGSSEYWAEQAQDHYDNAKAEENFTREENATISLSDFLKDSFEEQWDEIIQSAGKSLRSSMWADLMGAALSEVDWHEIAEHLIEDVDKADPEEDEDEDDDTDEIEAK